MMYPRRSPILASRVGKPIPTDLAAWYRYNTGITSSGGTVSAWANQTGGEALVQATAENRPQFLTYTGTKYMNLTGRAGAFASTPDANPLDITGDIDLRWYGSLTNWSTATQSLVDKFGASGQRSYFLRMNSGGNGYIELVTSADGTAALTANSGVIVPFANNQFGWVRATLDVDDGAGNRVYRFYTSTDGQNWTQLGSTVTTAGTTSIFAGTRIVTIGADSAGTAGLAAGKVYRTQIYNGIAGTLVFDADFTAQAENATSFAESANGATVTLNGSAQLIGATSANTLLFNGVDSFLKTAPFTLNQPTTVYFLGRQVTWTSSMIIYDGDAVNSGVLQQTASSPQIRAFAGSGSATISPNLGAYAVVSTVFNGAASVLQLNLDSPVTGNFGSANMGGFTLGRNGLSGAFSNIQCKEVLIYNSAHDANQRAAVIAYLNMVNQL